MNTRNRMQGPPMARADKVRLHDQGAHVGRQMMDARLTFVHHASERRGCCRRVRARPGSLQGTGRAVAIASDCAVGMCVKACAFRWLSNRSRLARTAVKRSARRLVSGGVLRRCDWQNLSTFITDGGGRRRRDRSKYVCSQYLRKYLRTTLCWYKRPYPVCHDPSITHARDHARCHLRRSRPSR